MRRAVKRLRAQPAGWEPVRSGGHTPARRWIVTLEDGRTAFAKVATDELTASWLRDEHVVYQHLLGAPFVPGHVGYHDDGEHPVLALEDLSAGTWPPPWDAAGISALLASLEQMWATAPPPGTAVATDDAREIAGGWDEIARAPEPFLRLGLCSEPWLSGNLEALQVAADVAAFEGDALLHFDVRSDNVCFRHDDGRAVLIDWNLTSVGTRRSTSSSGSPRSRPRVGRRRRPCCPTPTRGWSRRARRSSAPGPRGRRSPPRPPSARSSSCRPGRRSHGRLACSACRRPPDGSIRSLHLQLTATIASSWNEPPRPTSWPRSARTGCA